MATWSVAAHVRYTREVFDRWACISRVSFGVSSVVPRQRIDSASVGGFHGPTRRQRSNRVASWSFFLLTAFLGGCSPDAQTSSVASANTAPPVPTARLPAPCAATYEALLDVATLARSYGRASKLFVGAIGELAGQLHDCMSQATTHGNNHPVTIRPSPLYRCPPARGASTGHTFRT